MTDVHKMLNVLRRAPLILGLMFSADINAQPVSFDEIRDYDEVFRISGRATGPAEVEVRWDIAPDYYLYHNKFLRFESSTPGVTLGQPQVPDGQPKYDPLLGQEVVKFHDQMRVKLPLLSIAQGTTQLSLQVRSQGCLEDVLCYPPSMQRLEIDLPGGFEAAPAGLSGLLGEVATPQDTVFQSLNSAVAVDVSEIFKFEAIGMDAATVLVRFTPLSGYYLYRDKFVFEIEAPPGYRIEQIQLPPGVIKDDPEFGPVPVYFDAIEIPLTLSRPAGPERQITLRAEFQGCKDGEICLPPQSERIEFTLDGSTTAVPGADRAGRTEVPQSEQDRLAGLLTQNPPMALLAFFVAGLLLAFTPCVFPMVPILSGLIAGQGQQLTTLRAFNLSLVYVLAMSLTYTLAGVLAGLFGQNLQAAFQSPWIISSFVAVFVVLALSMFGLFELQLPGRWQTALTERSNRQKGGRYVGVAVMGLLSALIVGPCVAPPLAAALIVIGASGDAMLGGSALFALSMGMGVPLIAFGVSAGKLIPTAGAWMDKIKKLFGVGLLALGIWMLERILAGPIILLLWGILAIGCGIYLGALQRLSAGASGRDRLIQALGVVLLVIGILELVGAASGGDRWTEPLRQLRLGQSDHAEQAPDFLRIKSVQDLEQALSASVAAGQVSLFDFYADWCVECIRMERTTFPEESVAALMREFTLIQADVTPNDEIDQALMSRFGIIGPPAILFFDRRGEEMRAFRLIGYFTPDDFAKHLERVLENG